MLKTIDIATKNTELTPRLRTYTQKKIGTLDRFIPKKHREGTHVDVVLTEEKSKDKRQFTCGVVIRTPIETFEAKETNINMHAAIDVAENKLKTQLKKFKETHTDGKKFRHLFARTLRRGEEVR